MERSSPLPSFSSQLRVCLLSWFRLPDLFNTRIACHTFRDEGLPALRNRLRRLGIAVSYDASTADCKRLYLWHYGRPQQLFENPNMSLATALYSQGLLTLNHAGLIGLPFAELASNVPQPSIQVGLAELGQRLTPVDLQVFHHAGVEYALVAAGSVRIIRLDTGAVCLDLRNARAATVDSTGNTQRVAYLRGDGEQLELRWTLLASCIAGQPQWTTCRSDRLSELPIYQWRRVALDFSAANEITVLEVRDEYSPVPHLILNLDSEEWRSANALTIYSHADRSPHACTAVGHTGFLCEPQQVLNLDPLSLQLHPAGLGFPTIQLCQGTIPLRRLWLQQPMDPRRPIALQTLQAGATPILLAGFATRVDQQATYQVWRLAPWHPDTPFGAFEQGGLMAPTRQEEVCDAWGDTLLTRAARLALPRTQFRTLLLPMIAKSRQGGPEAADRLTTLRMILSSTLEHLVLGNHPAHVALVIDEFPTDLLPDDLPHLLARATNLAFRHNRPQIAALAIAHRSFRMDLPNATLPFDEWHELLPESRFWLIIKGAAQAAQWEFLDHFLMNLSPHLPCTHLQRATLALVNRSPFHPNVALLCQHILETNGALATCPELLPIALRTGDTELLGQLQGKHDLSLGQFGIRQMALATMFQSNAPYLTALQDLCGEGQWAVLNTALNWILRHDLDEDTRDALAFHTIHSLVQAQEKWTRGVVAPVQLLWTLPLREETRRILTDQLMLFPHGKLVIAGKFDELASCLT